MKNVILLTILLLACWKAPAQSEPAATGPGGLPLNGSLEYSVRYSQIAFLYGTNQVHGGNQVDSTVAASLNYSHPSQRRPFSMEYGGGYMWPISGQSLGTGIFQHLWLSQGFVQRRWSLLASDGVSYTPEAPILGFSGVPGTGEPVGGSGSTPASGQSILTIDTRVLSNRADLTFSYMASNAVTVSVEGGSELLRYPEGNGLESDGVDVGGDITRRFDARNSLSGHYSYSHFSYEATAYTNNAAGSFGAHSAFASYRRLWSRRLTMELAAGPQWTVASDNALVPAIETVFASAALNYRARSQWLGVSYSRGINGGAGYLPGATVQTVEGDLARNFKRDLMISVMGAYMRTAALQAGGGYTNARFGGIQASRRLGPYLSIFGSYTGIEQSSELSSSIPQINLLNQPYHVISFGIGYAPRELRLKR